MSLLVTRAFPDVKVATRASPVLPRYRHRLLGPCSDNPANSRSALAVGSSHFRLHASKFLAAVVFEMGAETGPTSGASLRRAIIVGLTAHNEG